MNQRAGNNVRRNYQPKLPLLVTVNVVLIPLISSALMMKAIPSSETLRHIPEDGILQNHSHAHWRNVSRLFIW
jgi:hypothetical protein